MDYYLEAVARVEANRDGTAHPPARTRRAVSRCEARPFLNPPVPQGEVPALDLLRPAR
jgi:hypothetical protein